MIDPTMKGLSILDDSPEARARREARRAEIERREAEAAGRQRRMAIGDNVRRLAQALGRRYGPDACTLDGYILYHRDQRAVLDRLRALVPALPEFIARGRGLLLYGTVGTGKDHLLAAMLYAAARQGITCHWVNGQELFGAFRDNIASGRREAEILNDLAEPQVLAISDPIPPAAAPTAWNVAQLLRLIDRRYREMKSTWATLNALSPEDADAKLSAPVFDRLRENAEMVRCFWPSYRERVSK
jgi:DNA replication protein DnaC